MREILFRGKRLQSNNEEWGTPNQQWTTSDIWEYGYYSKLSDSKFERLNHQIGTYRVNPATVGQYTGLNDKHGNRIFEGDIVILNGSKAQYAVFWKNGDYQCGFCVAENGVDYPLANYLTAEYTVVGNIHDNDFKEDKQ